MTEPCAQWPGFVPEPCADCGCPGDHHQPVCVAHTTRNGRPEYCLCPAYRASVPQQPDLFDTRKLKEAAA